MRRGGLLLILVLLAACAARPADGAIPSPASASATQAAAEPETPAATAIPPPEPPAIDEILPTHLGDLELHTFETGRDMLGRLAANLGLLPTDLDVAYASEHGDRFLQLYAIRAPGFDGPAVLDAFVDAAFLPSGSDIDVSEERIAGHDATVVHSDAEAQFIGDFYAVDLGHTLVVAQAFDRAVAEEGLAALR